MRRYIVLLALAGALACSARAADFGKPVTWDCYGLLVDGVRVCPVMGELHYARLPEQEWPQAVHRMKEGGVTMLAT